MEPMVKAVKDDVGEHWICVTLIQQLGQCCSEFGLPTTTEVHHGQRRSNVYIGIHYGGDGRGSLRTESFAKGKQWYLKVDGVRLTTTWRSSPEYDRIKGYGSRFGEGCGDGYRFEERSRFEMENWIGCRSPSTNSTR
jgi:hypothetical protein